MSAHWIRAQVSHMLVSPVGLLSGSTLLRSHLRLHDFRPVTPSVQLVTGQVATPLVAGSSTALTTGDWLVSYRPLGTWALQDKSVLYPACCRRRRQSLPESWQGSGAAEGCIAISRLLGGPKNTAQQMIMPLHRCWQQNGLDGVGHCDLLCIPGETCRAEWDLYTGRTAG